MKAKDHFFKDLSIGDYIATGSCPRSKEIQISMVTEVKPDGSIRTCSSWSGGSLIKDTWNSTLKLPRDIVPSMVRSDIKKHIIFRIDAIKKRYKKEKIPKNRQDELEALEFIEKIGLLLGHKTRIE
jgi:hypothetical protein